MILTRKKTQQQHQKLIRDLFNIGWAVRRQFLLKVGGGGGEELEQANLYRFKFPVGCLWDSKALNWLMHFIHSLLEWFLITFKEGNVKDGTEDEKLRICNIYKKKQSPPYFFKTKNLDSSSHPYLNYDQSQSCKPTLQQLVRSFSKVKDKKVNHLVLHSGLVKSVYYIDGWSRSTP